MATAEKGTQMAETAKAAAKAEAAGKTDAGKAESAKAADSGAGAEKAAAAKSDDSKDDKLEAGVDFPKVESDSGVVEVSAGVTPDAGKDDLLSAAQVKAPHLTAEFIKEHDLDDDYLARVARGEEPPPPYNGPVYVTDLHRTPGGWQITPKGVKPEDVGKNAISR